MKTLRLNFLFKLLLLIFFFFSFSLLFSSKALADCITDPSLCPPGFVCEDRGTGGFHCFAPEGQNCSQNGGFCVNGSCPTGSGPGSGLCPGNVTCCQTTENACTSADCTPACVSPETCSGTKPNCNCQSGGGGGGGDNPPSDGEIPPKGVYLSCYKHDEKCWVNVAKNGIQCCDKSDTCVPIPWVSFNGEWPGVCKNPVVPVIDTTCNGSWCDTALGKISTNVSGFSKSLFGIVLGISGGIAVILIILSGYKLMTSRGNPEQLQQAKEQLTAAIVGLLFIIFSLVILQSIGVDILQLPGFRG